MRPPSPPEQRPEPADRPVVSGVGRRRLLRAGAAAAPVLLTLRSGPVSAGTSGCVVASSFVSAATLKSRNGGSVTVDCGRYNCEWWRSESWKTPCQQDTLKRKNWQCVGSDSRNSFKNDWCYDVMKQGSGIATSGELGVIQHLTALINNCDAGFVNTSNPGFNKAYLQSVRQNYYDNGRRYRLPSAGIDWSEAELIGWLRAMLGYAIL